MEKLTTAGSRALGRLEAKLTIQSGIAQPTADCPECSDTGMVIGPSGAKRCECVHRRARARFYAFVPAEFREITLETVQPNASRHPRQAEAIEMIRKTPYASYLLFGANGVGKSLLSWLIVMKAYEDGRDTVAIELDRLLKQYRRYEFNDEEKPEILADDLREGAARYTLHRRDWTVLEDITIERKPITIFLDEISATSPTEYAAKEFFYLLKAAHEFGHQVVMTCNVTPKQLQVHWSRIDAFWGNSISRRIAEYMELVDLTK